MLRIYKGTDLPRYLDATARDLLGEGRASFYRYQLHERALIQDGNCTLFFPWVGDRRMDTLLLWLAGRKIDVTREGVALVFEGMTSEAVEDLKTTSESLRPKSPRCGGTRDRREEQSAREVPPLAQRRDSGQLIMPPGCWIWRDEEQS